MNTPILYYFEDDGLTPNNRLPVLVYKNVGLGIKTDLSDYLEATFKSNNWTNNWRDIILTRNHYHSSTHEVLGISKGKVQLCLGGKKGKELIAKAGDVLLIPAGVGHYSLNNDTPYEVVGGYPDGMDWDLIYDEPDKYLNAKKAISQIDLPNHDPVYGKGGSMHKFWM